ncbi:Pyrokinin-1 receptor [Bulinus truncatus]|nr:Pyrokinin-1 receptor [Bulinus truncatus]
MWGISGQYLDQQCGYQWALSGPAMSRSAIGMSRAAPGMSSAALEMSRSAIGMSRAAPGMSSAALEMSRSAIGMSRAAPGMSSAALEMSRSAIGMSRAAPGMSSAALEMSRAALGMSRSALGMSRSALGMSRSALGMTRSALGMSSASRRKTKDRSAVAIQYPLHTAVPRKSLPPELYSIWEAYPWHFGETFCIFKAFVPEMTSYTSVLTITSFTVERYIAICHPIRGQKTSRQSRAVKCIISIWILAAFCALPYPIHTRVYTFVHDPRDQRPIEESVVCNIPFRWQQRMSYMFQISTFVFFIIPMAVITGMYLMIGMRLRSSAMTVSFSHQSLPSKTAASRARRAVLKMLGAYK